MLHSALCRDGVPVIAKITLNVHRARQQCDRLKKRLSAYFGTLGINLSGFHFPTFPTRSMSDGKI